MLLGKLLPSLVVNGAFSTIAYFVLRRECGSDVVALALTGGIPAVWTLGRFAWRRRVDPIGVLAVVGYALAVLFSFLTGGSPLALELHEPALTGVLGLVCMVSVTVRRPLHQLVLHLLARRNPTLRQADDGPTRRRMSMILTALVGTTLLAHAIALVILAVSLPPSTFMVLRHPIGLPILGLGAAALVWYRHHLHVRSHGRDD